MSKKQHGHFTLAWHDTVCLIRTVGIFNDAATSASFSALTQSWEQMGSPQRWVLLVDMRPWEGGTPESFVTARKMAEWTFCHGLAASLRLHSGLFLPRVVDRQRVLDNSPAPIVDFKHPLEVIAWLTEHGFACAGLEAALTDIPPDDTD